MLIRIHNLGDGPVELIREDGVRASIEPGSYLQAMSSVVVRDPGVQPSAPDGRWPRGRVGGEATHLEDLEETP